MSTMRNGSNVVEVGMVFEDLRTGEEGHRVRVVKIAEAGGWFSAVPCAMVEPVGGCVCCARRRTNIVVLQLANPELFRRVG